MGLPANEFVYAAKFTGIFLRQKNLKYQPSGKKKISFMKRVRMEPGMQEQKKEMLGKHFCGSSLRCCAAETDSQFIFTPTVL